MTRTVTLNSMATPLVGSTEPAESHEDLEVAAETRLKALVAKHRRAVFAHTLRLTSGDAGWAEDVVQETFLRAWRRWEHMTPEHGSVRGWLMRVAHNLVMDGYRSARMGRGEVPLDVVDDVAIPESTDQILASHVVHEALQHLPEPHRQALEATYFCDQTAAQAAHNLDVPVGTVKSRVFYGLRMLRSIMKIDAAAAA
jgi:RNA polymerase sigma-70 factor, ECF subfamily